MYFWKIVEQIIRLLSLTRRKHSDGQQNTSSVFTSIPMAVGEIWAASRLRIVSAYGERINLVPCIRTARSVFPHRRIASSRQPGWLFQHPNRSIFAEKEFAAIGRRIISATGIFREKRALYAHGRERTTHHSAQASRGPTAYSISSRKASWRPRCCELTINK